MLASSSGTLRRMRRVGPLLVAAGLSAWTIACGSNRRTMSDATGSDAASPDALSLGSGDASRDAGLEDAIPGIDSEAAACALLAFNPLVVCFGSDSAPYLTYLKPDAGVLDGFCPTKDDFIPLAGEGAPCGYSVCGPFTAAPADGEATIASCCFWVLRVCGV